VKKKCGCQDCPCKSAAPTGTPTPGPAAPGGASSVLSLTMDSQAGAGVRVCADEQA
jgi:hypothetical protein